MPEQACCLIELIDQFINFFSFFSKSAPCIFFVIPKSIELVAGLTLLLYPCVVFEVVDSLSVCISEFEQIIRLFIQDMLVIVESCFLVGVFSLLILKLFDS